MTAATLERSSVKRGGRAAIVSRILAVLAGCALATAGLLFYAERTVFDSDAFASRADAALTVPAVRVAMARRLTDVVIGVRPNLVGLRPLIELGSRQVVGTSPFRSLVRAAALDAHRSAFDRRSRELTVQIRDAGLLIAAAVRRLSPGLAKRIPAGAVTRVARLKGGLDGWMLRGAERADAIRQARWPALAACLLLAIGAFAITDSRRASVLRLGVAAGLAGAVVALATLLVPGLVAGAVPALDRVAVKASLGVWLDPLRAWAVAAFVVGSVVAIAAGATVRRLPVGTALRRIAARAFRSPRSRLGRAARAAAVLAVGTALVASPRRVLTAALVAVGALLVLAALADLLGVAAGPAEEKKPASRRRGLRVGAAVAAIAAVAAFAAALSSAETPTAPRVGRCNGHAALCGRTLDRVAFLGTHNSMAAAGEAGWLFAAQDDGIPQQLGAGVRALLIDTYYGTRTTRGVATDLQGHSIPELAGDLAGSVIATVERLRKRIGAKPTGKREIFLCHAFCELGATRALEALKALHRFLVLHPDEVVLISIQDSTSAADTAALVRASGLIDEIYTGGAAHPWPTLRELIDRDQRVVVFSETRRDGPSWLHYQPATMQETPYRFTTEKALAAPTSCRPNRGGTAGSLLLVNHWVDTSPAPRVTIARRVNALDLLTRRLALCRRTRGMLPNIVAVDFYRQGDAARAVDQLNGAG